MRHRIPLASLALILAVAASAGCTDDARSPVGVDILPGGILEGGLQSVASSGFSRATDYTIFPAHRADGDRLPGALAWPEAPGIESRPIFRFVLARADTLAGAEILDASVRLVYSLASAPTVPVTYTLHRVTAEWSEDAATWDRRLLGAPWATPGGDFDPDPVAEFAVPPAVAEPDSAIQADTLQVEVPVALVEGWDDGSIANHGLILIQRTPGERVEFASRGGAEEALNNNGPSLLMNQRLESEGNPVVLTTILAREDTFLPLDASPLPGDPGLTVSAGDPTRRIFVHPTLDDVPVGVTVAGARLVMTVAAAEVPSDTFRIVALEAESEFLGEKTIYAPVTSSRFLGFQNVTSEIQPGDTVVFEGTRLTRVVRAWLARPETNLGIGILAFEEGTAFGAVRFHGPEAAAAVRPRLQLLVLPPPAASGPR